jgi:hypothetical protein
VSGGSEVELLRADVPYDQDRLALLRADVLYDQDRPPLLRAKLRRRP